MSLISIIVPVYNSEHCLERCVQSILSQTHQNLEVLLIDDGSTDLSGKLCDEYACIDPRIRVTHTENGGVSKARNLGLSQAQGEWLIFVDSDDWLETQALEKMLRFTTDNCADLGIFSLFFEGQKGASQMKVAETVVSPRQLFSGMLTADAINKLICSPCNKLYKKSIISENGLAFKTGIKFGEDFIFNSEYLPFAQKLATQNIAYYHYDCSTLDSGVKKLHKDYDIYILAMQDAMKHLFEKLNLHDTISFQHSFISDRWDYAINICLQSALSDHEKADLLYQWFLKLPEKDWQVYTK